MSFNEHDAHPLTPGMKETYKLVFSMPGSRAFEDAHYGAMQARRVLDAYEALEAERDELHAVVQADPAKSLIVDSLRRYKQERDGAIERAKAAGALKAACLACESCDGDQWEAFDFGMGACFECIARLREFVAGEFPATPSTRGVRATGGSIDPSWSRASWCPYCRAHLAGGEHFEGRTCGTCHTKTVEGGQQ